MNSRFAAIVVCCFSLAIVHAQTPPEVDRRAAEAAIAQADRDFNQSVADRNLQRFLSLVAENASFGQVPNRGREAIAKAWAPFFEADGPRLTWAPTKAEVLVGGDLGYTVGTWERREKGRDGRTTTTRGQYLTVWSRQPDGSWQAVYDNGSVNPASR